MYTAYILRSEKHNTGKVRSTKAYRPWKVIHTEKYKTKSEAYKREMFFKSIEGYKFLKKEGLL